MKCLICKHDETQPGKTIVTLQRAQSTVICKDVPAEICGTCGEYYLSEETTREVMKRAEAAVRNGAEVEILRFAA